MNSQKLLCAMLKTAQTGQVVLRCAMATAMAPGLRETLLSQIREYDATETEALSIAQQRGWEPREPDILLTFLIRNLIRFRLSLQKSDSRTAEIMIRRNTAAIIGNLRDLHRYQGQDPSIRILAQKLLDCDTAHNRRLQKYL